MPVLTARLVALVLPMAGASARGPLHCAKVQCFARLAAGVGVTWCALGNGAVVHHHGRCGPQAVAAQARGDADVDSAAAAAVGQEGGHLGGNAAGHVVGGRGHCAAGHEVGAGGRCAAGHEVDLGLRIAQGSFTAGREGRLCGPAGAAVGAGAVRETTLLGVVHADRGAGGLPRCDQGAGS